VRGLTLRNGEPTLPAAPYGRPLRVALVNNMPDAAFVDAEHQFLGLLRAGAGTRPLEVRLHSMDGGVRSDDVRERLRRSYRPLDELYRDPPDAVVVTGSEPRSADLPSEPIWDELVTLFAWVESSATSVLYSCLAAHAALVAVDGVERRRLPAKVSGIYEQVVAPSHPLTAGLGRLWCPHSRLHDVPAAALVERGYTVHLASADGGWTVASRDRGGLTVLFQGHPEYSPTTLLREYRRDVRRFLVGRLDRYPELPTGYLDPDGVALATAFRDRATSAGADESLIVDFPFEECADRVVADWRRPMRRLAANWITEVRRRQLQDSWAKAG
jgi:homoserine O-succinyltransferase